jgi:hypothetical protein
MIIKHHGYVKHPITFVCPHCGCEFEAVDGEYLRMPADDYGESFLRTACPECSTVTDSDSSSGPFIPRDKKIHN